MPLTSARFSLAWKRLSVCLVGAALAWGGVTAAEAAKPRKVSAAKPSAAKPSARASAKAVSAKGKSARTASVVDRRGRRGRVAALAGGRHGRSRGHSVVRAAPPEPPRLSYGQIAGLHAVADPLDLKSSVALVVDQDTREILFSKNGSAVLPIASLTKLMTGMVISESRLPMEAPITITEEDVDTERGSRSRLTVGTTITRGEALHLALMSSENRAAHALGRTFPGGLTAFIERMNQKARALGMQQTRYVDPTGLSSLNQSTANDLAVLASHAYHDPLVRGYSTSPSYQIDTGTRVVQYQNTNRLVNNPQWEIGLQKTGYISEAGRCLVMQTKVAGRQLIMVFLDSAGKFSRLGDAERVRRWLEARTVMGSIGPVHLSKPG